MKQDQTKITVLLLCLLILIGTAVSACQSAETQPQESPTIAATETELPTKTAVPNTPTPEPAATETPVSTATAQPQNQEPASPQPPTQMPEPEVEVENEPTLDVQPAKALLDEPVTIQASGLEPGQLITLTGSMNDDFNRKWQSSATFIANDDGIVDVTTQAPITGTYTTVDPMGLFWSMLPVTTASSNNYSYFANWEETSRMVTIKAEVDGKEMATAYTERLRLHPDVSKTPLDEEGLVGSLFTPDAEGTYPALLVLGGSDGGIDIPRAAMLASHGYVTLALDYFGNSPLPAELNEIPLEYFKTAIDWLQTQESVDANKIGVVGTSRGGELALLLGATYPEITAVVGYVPSGVVMRGISNTNPDEAAAWTLNGTPIPFATSWETVEETTIPVEQINGPILLISGKDDQTWPSAVLSEIAMDRLRENDHPYPYEHLSYEEAGHLIGLPYLPTTGGGFAHNTTTGEAFTLGGTPHGDTIASADSWAHVLTFLENAFNE